MNINDLLAITQVIFFIIASIFLLVFGTLVIIISYNLWKMAKVLKTLPTEAKNFLTAARRAFYENFSFLDTIFKLFRRRKTKEKIYE